MLDQLADPSRRLADVILPLYLDTTFAYSLATLMALVAAALIVIAIVRNILQVRHIKAREQAISSEIAGLTGGTPEDGSTALERNFRDNFDHLDNLLVQSPFMATGLSLAWHQYRRTLHQTETGIYQSPFRPRVFFLPANRASGSLDFSANIFVAFGLLATFVGLVAALNFAAAGMESGDPGAMQAAITDLLAASASKFVTSIAGVGLSIVLRIAGRLLASRHQAALLRLCDTLEAAIRIDPGSARGAQPLVSAA